MKGGGLGLGFGLRLGLGLGLGLGVRVGVRVGVGVGIAVGVEAGVRFGFVLGQRRAVELCEQRGVEVVVHMGQVVARVPEVDAGLSSEVACKVGRVVTGRW